MGKLEKESKAPYPDEPFSFSFLNEGIADLYAGDFQIEWWANVAIIKIMDNLLADSEVNGD